MKKLIFFILCMPLFFSCNPDGTNQGEAGTIVGTYKLGTILVRSNELGVSTGLFTNSCIQESTLIIDGNYNFELTHIDLDTNNTCVQTDHDTGRLVNVGAYGFNRQGKMEFINSAKNCNFNALGTQTEGIHRFTFTYTIPSSTNASQSTSYEFNFGKTN